MKKLLTVLFITPLLLFLASPSDGQSIIPNSSSGQALINFAGATDISSDIIATPTIPGSGGSAGYLWAVGYGTNNSYWYQIRHSNGATASAGGSNFAHEDVALADDRTQLGSRYNFCYVGTQYMTSTPRRVMLGKMKINQLSSGIIVKDLDGHVYLDDGVGYSPHIDLFADTILRVASVTPSFHRLVATWGEEDDTLQFALSSTHTRTDLSKHAFFIGDTVRNVDVGAQFLVDSNQRVAHICFTRDTVGRTYIYHAEINCSAATPYIKRIDTLGYETARISHLRVEAMSLYSTAKGGIQWGLVYKRANNQVVHFNSMNLTGELLNSRLGNGYSPCIAAGSGLTNSSNTSLSANKHYTTAFTGNCNDVLCQYVNVDGTREFKNYYNDVNDTPVVTLVSITSAKNKGDKNLVAWYDGDTVRYKIFDTLAAGVAPNWPATTPSLPDMPLWLSGTAGRIEWVNTDRYNLYLTNDNTVKGYIQAVANDFYDFSLGTYKVVVNVYSSVTNTTRTVTLANMRHPDIVILDDHEDSLDVVDTPNYEISIVFEDASTSNNRIYTRTYEVKNPFDDNKFQIVQNTTNAIPVGHATNANKCPHIDAGPNENPDVFPVPQLYTVLITWSEDDGGWKTKNKHSHAFDVPNVAITLGPGENPDVARTVENNVHYDYVVTYDATNQNLICYKLDGTATNYRSVIDSTVIDAGIIVTAPPRIEAFNRLPGTNDVQWIAVAEVLNDGYSEIREYRGGPCGVYRTIYNAIPVNNTSTLTTNLSNNPLHNNNGYSPCVAAGNGQDTYSDPSALGNSNYTLGWWIDGEQYNALTVAHDSYQPATSGYARVNTANVGLGVVSAGYCRLALANGSNDGAGLVAAWAADTTTGPMIVIKQSNTFSFKPASVKVVENQELQLYPNPSSDRIYIPTKLNQSYFISNIAGEVLTKGSVKADGVDVQGLTPGVYFIRIQDEKGQISRARFVKR